MELDGKQERRRPGRRAARHRKSPGRSDRKGHLPVLGGAALATALAAGSIVTVVVSGHPDPAHTATASAAARAASVSSPRVMIEGDSITQGFSGDTTWRYWISRELDRQGVSANFVGPYRGSTKGPRNRFGGRYAHPFDSDHSALAGSTLLSPVHVGSIRARVEEYQPDVILVMLGFNDLNKGQKSAAQVAKGMRRYVAGVREVSPTTRIVIGQVMPARYRSGQPRPMPYRAVNDRLARLAGSTPRVTLAMTAVGWNSRNWTTDGTHPNPTGETILAQRFAVALRRAGVLRSQPDLSRTLAWKPRFTQHKEGGRRRFTLGWPGQKPEWTITGFRVVYKRQGSSHQTQVFTRHPQLTVRNLTPGRYAVTTTPLRKWMVGRPLPTTHVRVLPALRTRQETASTTGPTTGPKTDAETGSGELSAAETGPAS